MAIEWAVVLATIAGPILAVQIQKHLERGRDQHQRRVWIFQTLMRTRAAQLSQDHVNALNAVPIEFHGKAKSDKAVVNAWNLYLDHLNDRVMDRNVWAAKRIDLLVDLLEKMGTCLKYELDEVYIRRGVYSPEGHAIVESEQEIIRRGFVALVTGERPLSMDIRNWPVDHEALEIQKQMQSAMLEWAKRASPPPPLNEPK
jgi:hypothetical protein